jgi:hypothetical protein
MTEIITRRALPEEWADLAPGFRPYLVEETDMDRLMQDADGSLHQRRRRTRVLVVITPDGKPEPRVYDLGPATGEMGTSFPCAGAVEMAQIWDMLEWSKEIMQERREREAVTKPIRTAAFLKRLEEAQHENDMQLNATSTFGPGFRKQREN